MSDLSRKLPDDVKSRRSKLLLGILAAGAVYSTPVLTPVNEAMAQVEPIIQDTITDLNNWPYGERHSRTSKVSRYSRGSRASRHSRVSRSSRSSRFSRASR